MRFFHAAQQLLLFFASGNFSMTLGIIGAMHQELSLALTHVTEAHTHRIAGRDFVQGRWHGHDVVLVLSRIGKVAAATTATALIERFNVQNIVFTGVAGGLGQQVRIGDVVVAQEFVQHDMNASPLFPPLEIPLYGKTRFATDTALSAALAQACSEVLTNPTAMVSEQAIAEFQLHQPQLHQGLIISGDQFVHSHADCDRLRTLLPDALAVEMEGAAVAQVCHDYGIPFAAMRTLSDRADDDATHDFTRFVVEVASQYSAAILDKWLAQ